MPANVVYVPRCLRKRVLRANMLACQRGLVPTCLPANALKACQLLIFTCVFKHSSYKIIRRNFYTIMYYIYIYIYRTQKLYYTSFLYFLLYYRKVGGVFLFYYYFLFCPLVRFSEKWKYKKTSFLHVTSNKGFLEFSVSKTTKQNKEYVWVLSSFWIVICLSSRSEINTRNLTVTMFFSVSYDFVFKCCSS